MEWPCFDEKVLEKMICCDISSRGRLRLGGEDRVRFLNGQTTNDIKLLPDGKGCYAALTNAKGKMRADAVVLNFGNFLWLDLEHDQDLRIAGELEKFVISDDVAIENLTETWSAFTLIGPEAGGALSEGDLCSSAPKDLFSIEKGKNPSTFVFKSRRSQADSFDIWMENSQKPVFEELLAKKVEHHQVEMKEPSFLETLRIEAGIPRFGAEMDENTLPQEAGIESLAISYNKGCYIGQEVISRIKSMGHVHRTLVRLRLPPKSQAGEPLLLESRAAGRLGSAVDSPEFGRIGLAIVRREASQPGIRLSLPGGECEIVSEF